MTYSSEDIKGDYGQLAHKELNTHSHIFLILFCHYNLFDLNQIVFFNLNDVESIFEIRQF